ncbi:MAG: hypothetical protein JWQ98_1190 [Chlorobi bacterium]|nr:hypothetical protein [Chlorobiota bacterium]
MTLLAPPSRISVRFSPDSARIFQAEIVAKIQGIGFIDSIGMVTGTGIP